MKEETILYRDLRYSCCRVIFKKLIVVDLLLSFCAQLCNIYLPHRRKTGQIVKRQYSCLGAQVDFWMSKVSISSIAHDLAFDRRFRLYHNHGITKIGTFLLVDFLEYSPPLVCAVQASNNPLTWMLASNPAITPTKTHYPSHEWHTRPPSSLHGYITNNPFKSASVGKPHLSPSFSYDGLSFSIMGFANRTQYRRSDQPAK